MPTTTNHTTHATPLDEHPVWSIDPRLPGPVPARREWMLANGLGGYAMGTVLGVPTRRYHGLLVAAMAPPVLRILALAAIDDAVIFNPDSDEPTEHRLTRFHFATAADRPCLHPSLVRFEKEDFVRWTFELPGPAGGCGPVTVRKTVQLADGRNAVMVRYELPEGIDARLELRPLVALRDFHSLLTGHEHPISARELPGISGSPGVLVSRRELGLHITGRGVDAFEPDEHAWKSIELFVERERGLDDQEDLFCPGVFTAKGPGAIDLVATTDASGREGWLDGCDARRRRRRGMIDAVLARTHHAAAIPARAASQTHARTRLAQLAAAADAYIVQRVGSSIGKTTVIAGYPWFADWGRDTMIALPGLLLATGRHEEAFDVLRTFANNQRRGLIPNRFDDHAGPAHYNTVDAPLWFLHACTVWLTETGDRQAFNDHLRPACDRVVRAYAEGTDYNIKVDPVDGLVAAGSPDTQLTWMDARRDGVVFTPRHGKAVEINALWIHGLRALAVAVAPDDDARAAELNKAADHAAASFRAQFMGGPGGGLIDCITPNQSQDPSPRSTQWIPSTEIRPNQVFAAALEHAPLTQADRRAVVQVAREHLLTPQGMRTLSPTDPRFEPYYRGPLFQRDRAYHNGTVWPWLLGSFCEALMRSENFSQAARSEAADRLLALTDAVDTVSIGQIPEVADATPGPDGQHRFDGAPAQAWSIAETLRALTLALDQHAAGNNTQRAGPG